MNIQNVELIVLMITYSLGREKRKSIPMI